MMSHYEFELAENWLHKHFPFSQQLDISVQLKHALVELYKRYITLCAGRFGLQKPKTKHKQNLQTADWRLCYDLQLYIACVRAGLSENRSWSATGYQDDFQVLAYALKQENHFVAIEYCCSVLFRTKNLQDISLALRGAETSLPRVLEIPQALNCMKPLLNDFGTQYDAYMPHVHAYLQLLVYVTEYALCQYSSPKDAQGEYAQTLLENAYTILSEQLSTDITLNAIESKCFLSLDSAMPIRVDKLRQYIESQMPLAA